MDIAKQVVRVRLSQMIVNEKYKDGKFKVPIHLALGHEAIAVAVDSIMHNNDRLVLSHRNIHYNLVRERLLKREIDEYLLNDEGLAKGKLGSMNLANEEKGIVYTSSILGNNFPVATGVALSKKIKKEDGIVIAVTGDGAMEEGSFYESLVFLKSNNLPLLMIIENNEWSLATKIHERRCPINIKKFSESLGIDYELFSLNDAYKYSERLKELKEYALKNKTPICLEVKLTTLGYWRQKTEEFPDGKFINYHAGPAPEVSLKNGSIIENNESDPVYVVKKYFDQGAFEAVSREILIELESELS